VGRWKAWQVSELYPYWKKESHRRLVEPFCGGLAVTLGLMPAKALLNDINPHLINFYKHLKSGLDLPIIAVNLNDKRARGMENNIRQY
jgi:DNA adenine methylase